MIRNLACIAAVALAAGVATSLGADANPTPAPVPAVPEMVPAWKLSKVVGQRDRARDEARALRRTLATSPDAEIALQLAGIVYGLDWRHMQRCWLSEGYRTAERHSRRIVRTNAKGSGASGPGQFMPGTWAGTPFGRLDIFNVTAQAFATGYMWSRGRRSEWAGSGC